MTAALAFLQHGEWRKQIEALGLMVGLDGDVLLRIGEGYLKLMKNR